MIGATVYIVVCSAKNLVRARLRRLREPRYLIGAAVGAAYVYFSFFAPFRGGSSRAIRRRRALEQTRPPEQLATLAATGPALTGLVMMLAAAAAWVVPFDSGMLDFSKAETELLFPAPVSRRSLLAHRMMRTQLGMLFGAVIVALAAPSLSGYTRLRISVGAWLLMCTLRVYFTGVTLARARLGAAKARTRGIAWLPLVVILACVALVAVEFWRIWTASPIVDGSDALHRLALVATTGISRFVLAPFMAAAWPLFAAWPQPYLLSLAASAAVLALTVIWVLQSDAAFQDVVEALDDRNRARQSIAAPGYTARAAAWRLAPAGRPEAVFAWKASLHTLRAIDRRGVIRIISIIAATSIAAIVAGRATGFAAIVGTFAVIASGMTVMLGPQILRVDIREDLEHLELVKTWPVRAAAVVRGELLWPGVMLTAIAWTTIAIALVLSGTVFARVDLADRVAAAGAAVLLAPALVFAQLLIHNATAMFFPAWVSLGSQRARGLDAMGQRLITLGGTFLALALIALPAAVPAGIVWVVLSLVMGPLAVIPAAAVGAAVIVVEVLLATEALAPVYERLDVSQVVRVE